MSVFFLLLHIVLVPAALARTPCQDVVCIEVEKSEREVSFYAVSRSEGVSILFTVTTVNLQPATPPKVTRLLREGRNKLQTLRPLAGKAWHYNYHYEWDWGAVGARHDDRVTYRLPYEAGRSFRFWQGPHGSLTHQDKSAYDFSLPLGTPVCAARSGLVLDVVDRFEEGGNDPAYRPMANKVLILHEDGTVAAYLHLLRGGMKVSPGDRVEAGDVIALSGNSGFTTGPHLHLEVFRTTEEMKQETLPIRYHTADGDGVVLEEKKWYRAD
jgi:murein DD-endopeptidase MepM/ murein hydrolase activator NlpD